MNVQENSMEELFPELATSKQAQNLMGRLQHLRQELYTIANPWPEVAEQWLTTEELAAVKNWLHNQDVEIAKLPDLDQALGKLIEMIAELAVLKVYVAIELPVRFLKELHGKCRELLGESLLLELEYDNHLLGGAVWEFRGKQWNYSLQKRLEEEFREEQIKKN